MTSPETIRRALRAHQSALRACRRCPDMHRPVVTGQPVPSPVLLMGQAPGAKEGQLGRPFAWTAGKTLFHWLASIGLQEAEVRERVYIAAVCRCFPGKKPKGGDRVPDQSEVDHCHPWLEAELELLRPRLVLPVGKLAIAQFLPAGPLKAVVGQTLSAQYRGHAFDLIPLPHPSGVSTWHRTEPGKSLLQQALEQISVHPAWRKIL